MDKYNLKQEKLDEMRRDMLIEQHIRADYENLLDHIEDQIGDLNDIIDTINESHKLYGHKFDLTKFLKATR